MFLNPEATKCRQGEQNEMRVDSETRRLFHWKNQERLIRSTRISKLDWCFQSYSHLPIDSEDCRDKNHLLIA